MSDTSRTAAKRMLWGAASGAVGATVLNAVTYGDMLLRGRGSSGAPATVAGKLAEKMGFAPLAIDNEEAEAANRRTAAGALLGYTTGVGIGVGYAAFNPGGTSHPVRTGVLLGLAAMAASDVPIALTGTSDPREWSRAAWLSDLVPHLAYGLATATMLGSRRGG